MKVKVITDSGSGLSKQKANNLGIDFLPLQVIVDEHTYLDGIDLDIDDLYDYIEQDASVQTSLPPLGMMEDLLEKYEEDGVTDVVLITLSNGLSSTNNTFQAAAGRHGIKVHTLDLYTTLAVENYCAIAASRLNDQDTDPEQIVAQLKESIDHSAGFLIAEDLDHLAKGGRLTPMAAALGGLLKIKPILAVSKDTQGKVDVWGKVRTMSKAIKTAADEIGKEIDDPDQYVFFILDARNEDGALAAEKELRTILGEKADIRRHPMYAVIACHTGMKAVGLQYIKKVQGA